MARRIRIAVAVLCVAGGLACGGEPQEAERKQKADDAPVLLFPIVKGGKWGYMDGAGKVVIELQYDCVWDFSEGLACVQKGWFRGYIDPAGTMVIEPQFGWAGRFSSGMAPVFIEAKAWGDAIQFFLATKNPRWTFINRKGEVQKRVRSFKGFPDFHEGKLCCGRDCWGTDGKGIKHDAEELRLFSGGLAAGRKGGKWGYLDHEMKWVIEPAFDGAGEFSEGLAPVGKAGEQEEKGKPRLKWGYADKTGNVIIGFQFEDARPFSMGLASVRVGDKWGCINAKGETVVQPAYAFVWPFSEGLARVWTGEKQGYINTGGEVVIEPRFDIGWEFSNGLARVSVGGKEGYIDKQGKYVWEPTE